MKNINIELNEENYEKLKLIATKEHRSIKATVEMLTLNYIHGIVTQFYGE